MDPADVYNKLREWHLARLRNIAKEGAEKNATTPASLIASDKEAIRQLIKAAGNAKEQKLPTKPINMSYMFWIWVLAQAVSVAILFQRSQNLTEAATVFIKATIGTAFLQMNYGMDSVDRCCFAAFYFLPILLLCVTSTDSFEQFVQKNQARNSGVIAKIQNQLSNSNFTTICSVALVIIESFFFLLPKQYESSVSSLSSFGPETRAALAFNSLIVFVLLWFSKLRSCENNLARKQLTQMEKEITGESDAKSSPYSLLNSLDKVEMSMQELLQRERAIADFSKTVIISFDKSLNVDAVSPSALMQWGYYQYEILNNNFSKFIFREDLNIVEEKLRQGNDGGPFEIVARIRKRDNTIADYNWYVDWSARLDRYFVACEDITDRMMLERARNDFIAQLTHDMRSPLAAVVMTLALFSEKVFGELPTKVYESIDRAQTGLNRVLDLISDILETEKLQHSKKTIAPVHLRVRELCNSIIAEQQSVAQERQVEFVLKGEELEVMADHNLMSRVFSNLLSNALSFSPTDSKITVEFVRSSESGLIRISDMGPGIHQDYHRMIFERYKTPKLMESKRISTGLGLWICREIVTAHGGMIGVESEPGKGSTFWLTLPLSKN